MNHSEVQQQMGDLKEDLVRLRNDLSGVLHTILEATRSEAGEAREKLESKARQQLDQLAAAMTGARDHGRMMAGRLCDHIETHPVGSVLGALGAGFIVGLLLNRKS